MVEFSKGGIYSAFLLKSILFKFLKKFKLEDIDKFEKNMYNRIV